MSLIDKSKWASWASEFKRKPLTQTLELTYNMFFEGKSIEQITKEREFKQESVERQIVELITKSLISVEDVVDKKNLDQIKESFTVENIESLQSIKESLPDDITYFEIKCTLASMCAQPKRLELSDYPKPKNKTKKFFRRRI